MSRSSFTPNFTQIPNVYIDQIIPTLKPAENMVLIILMRQLYGWHKEGDRMSITQFEKRTGMTRPTVIKATKSLVEKGILIRSGANQKGSYYEINLNYEIEGSKESLPENDQVVKKLYQSSKETLLPSSKESLPTKENYTKENLNKKDLQPKLSDHKEMIEALSKLCKMDLKIKQNAGRISKAVKQLRNANYSVQDLRSFYTYWYKEDWRGKKGQPPTPEQTLANIGKIKPINVTEDYEEIKKRELLEKAKAEIIGVNHSEEKTDLP